ncbi:hypothetical protein K1W54_38780, partial [Micromonospora sp. CPCC 205371]|nr:hypothetical protein [Micromonospora sp. CPCC 205371]
AGRPGPGGPAPPPPARGPDAPRGAAFGAALGWLGAPPGAPLAAATPAPPGGRPGVPAGAGILLAGAATVISRSARAA